MAQMAARENSLAQRLLPLVATIRAYRPNLLYPDLAAGLTVALFTIPQAMAYALIAGVSPSAGIMTAVVASILGAAFGSSEFLINGPTNAISVMIASNVAIVAGNGDPQRTVVLLTLIIGVGQLAAAALRFGSFTRFIGEPVLAGFTAGAGIYVAVNQLPSALGIEKSQVVTAIGGWVPPHNALFDLVRTVLSMGSLNFAALLLAAGAIVLVRAMQVLGPHVKHRIPGPFIAVALLGLAAWALGLGDPASPNKVKLVRDIELLTRTLPSVALPKFNWAEVSQLAGPALAIGLLGAVEAIAIGKSLASRNRHPFDANRQLIGEGVCNVGAALVGGFAASGSFTRTAVNHDSGAKTRLSCIFSGLFVLVLVLAFAPLANFIPIAVLAGLLTHVGIKLVNVGKLKLIMEATIADRRVLIWTFVAVLVTPDLVYALLFGVALSVYHALRRAEGFKLERLIEEEGGYLVETTLGDAPYDDVVTLDLKGELFFAAAEELEARLRAIQDGGAKYIVLRLHQAYNVDATFAEALAAVGREARSKGGRLILAGIRPGMLGTLERAGVVKELGEDAVLAHEPTLLGSTHKAIALAKRLAAGENRATPMK